MTSLQYIDTILCVQVCLIQSYLLWKFEAILTIFCWDIDISVFSSLLRNFTYDVIKWRHLNILAQFFQKLFIITQYSFCAKFKLFKTLFVEKPSQNGHFYHIFCYLCPVSGHFWPDFWPDSKFFFSKHPPENFWPPTSNRMSLSYVVLSKVRVGRRTNKQTHKQTDILILLIYKD